MSIEVMNVGEDLKGFLVDEAGLDPVEIDFETKLFSEGYIDSITLAALVSFISEKFDVKVPPSGLTVENFDTISAQVCYIKSL